MPAPAVPPPTDDQRWRTDGVRHQILLRALPGQRHDVLGPLSVLRMGLTLFKRRLQADAVDTAALRERLPELEQQVAASVGAVAVMRGWDGLRQPPQAAGLLVRQCADLLRTGASLRGHRIDGPLAPEQATAELAVPDAHYAVLGWLMCALDAAPQATVFTLSLRADAVLLQQQALPDGQLQPLAPHSRRLDAQALGWLLADSGWHGGSAPDGQQVLRWPDPEPTHAPNP